MNLKRKLNQYVVYWPPDKVSHTGQWTYLTPVQLKGRWEDLQQDMVDQAGEVWVSKSNIMLDVPVAYNGVLWLGKLVNVKDLVNPFNNPGAGKIQSISSVPTLGARRPQQTVYTAYL